VTDYPDRVEEPIMLTLTQAEAAAVSVALVGLIHDPESRRWAAHASAVAQRLRSLRT
jgi:hypothetical protein